MTICFCIFLYEQNQKMTLTIYFTLFMYRVLPDSNNISLTPTRPHEVSYIIILTLKIKKLRLKQFKLIP